MSAIKADRGAGEDTLALAESGASGELSEDATTQWIVREAPWEEAKPCEAPASAAASSATPKSRRELAEERASELIGRVISERYLIEDIVAVGGIGCVYRGSHRHMRKRIAIKRLLPETEGLKDLVARFEREAVAGAHINHPNVAAATDFGQLADGSFFLVLEYANGVTLHELIERGPMEAARAVRIARQLAAALDAAHLKGVIHRDVKPRNVMVDEADHDMVKLIDFGLAKVPIERVATGGAAANGGEAASITGTGVVFGTVAYMSPEAGLGMAYVSEQSDIYALGLILYEMLAGAHPFGGREPAEIFRLHRTQAPPPIRALAPGAAVPPELEAVVMRMLRKEPGERYESAIAVIDALDDAMPGAALDAIGPSSSSMARPSRYTGLMKRWSAPPSQRPLSQKPPSSTSPSALAAGEQRGPISPRSGAPELYGHGDYLPRLSRGGGAPRRRGAMALVAIGVGAAALGVVLRLSVGRAPSGLSSARAVIESVAGAASAAGRMAVSAQALDAASVVKAAPAVEPAAAAIQGEAPAAGASSVNLRAALRDATDGRAWGMAADALLALVRADPAALQDRAIANAAIMVLMNMQSGAADRAVAVYKALATEAGSWGVDVLYEVLSTRGKSSAAARAAEALRAPGSMERATPALRIAMELRTAPCNEKPGLLERATAEGDLRAVAELDILRAEGCESRTGQCCLAKNAQVATAISLIRQRLGGMPR